MKPRAIGPMSGCRRHAATTNDSVTIPSSPTPSSMTVKLPNHSTSHATSPSGQDPPLETDAGEHLDGNRGPAELRREQQRIDDELRTERNRPGSGNRSAREPPPPSTVC